MYHEHIPVIVVYCSRVGFQEYKCSGLPACISDLVDLMIEYIFLINLLRDNLLAFKQARETQDYSGGSATTISCEVREAE